MISEEKKHVIECSLKQNIKILSSDYFEGRKTGTTGGKRAVDWIENQLKRFETPSNKLRNCLQAVPLLSSKIDKNNTKVNIFFKNQLFDLYNHNNCFTSIVNKNNFYSINKADIIFVGYGISAPVLNWNDYENVDVNGKAVVILLGAPSHRLNGKDPFRDTTGLPYARWTYKCKEAKNQGAIAVILIHDSEITGCGFDIVPPSIGDVGFDLEIEGDAPPKTQCIIWVDKEYMSQITGLMKKSYVDLVSVANNSDSFHHLFAGAEFSSSIVSNAKSIISNNVISILPGKSKPHEYVLVMAHWDHLGISMSDDGSVKIYNGAVDNCSGVSTLLGLVALLSSAPQLDRSILFLFTTGEEVGFLGARYFAINPVVPLENIIMGFSVDTNLPLGKAKDIEIVGGGLTDVDDLIKEVVAKYRKYIYSDTDISAYYKSDHIELAKVGIPMLQLSSGVDLVDGGKERGSFQYKYFKMHKYHTPNDIFDPEWDFSGMIEDVVIMSDIIATIALTDRRPAFLKCV